MKAIWNGAVIAESDDIVVIEGNAYFPQSSLVTQYIRPSARHTVCGWKGVCSYYDLVVDGEENVGAAWYYRCPKPGARSLAGRVAFWHGVSVEP
ncbi:DUF427 domain-containing protein [Pendulispora rubella]|uniref:DUF427 domain-containing protein n=1 Tax=Pendulispora rubella TaxID=2741070 RepID=A0ABZ2KV62_9BACT